MTEKEKKPLKVLAIMGSPRKGSNTEQLFNRLVAGIRDAGACPDRIVLREKSIAPCMEIYGCEEHGRCVIKDDFEEIYDKLESCDRMVMAFPQFFYGPPAQVKALIDRCQAFYVRKYVLKDPVCPEGAAKRSMYLVAIGDSGGKDLFKATFLILRPFLDVLDMEIREDAVYRNIGDRGDIFKHPTALEEAYEMGLRIGG